MRQTKIFNPRRCPYKQLKEHTGEALVYVFGPRGIINRIRLVSVPPQKDCHSENAYSQFEIISKETYDCYPRWGSYKSCFDDAVEEAVKYEYGINFVKKVSGRRRRAYRKVKKYTFEEVITQMKYYDKETGLKILHIEFN
jgi:hypothetical protein